VVAPEQLPLPLHLPVT
jgi:hypothetical protein